MQYKALEEIDLVRNQVQHPDDLTEITSRYSMRSLKELPSPMFINEDERAAVEELDERARRWLMPPYVHVTPKSLESALVEVQRFCEWFDLWLDDNAHRLRDACASGG